MKHFSFGSPTTCTYCGQEAEATDHVIPYSFQTNERKRRLEKTNLGPTTFACAWCNSYLSNRMFDSFYRRCEFVNEKIKSKVEPVIWHDWEIKQLDYKLRTKVLYEKKKRLEMVYRADWFLSRDFFLNIQSLKWSLEFYPDNRIVEWFKSLNAEINNTFDL